MSPDAAGTTVNDAGLRAALEAVEDIARHRHDDSAWHDVRVIARAALASAPAPAELDERIAEYVAVAIAGLKDGGGVTWNEAKAIGWRVARAANRCVDHGRRLAAPPAPAGLDDFGTWVRWFLDANPNAEPADLIAAIKERMTP